MAFTVIRQLGVGGMAVASLARDDAGGLVVLKRALSTRRSDENRLRDEGRLGKMLEHPAIVRTLGVVEEAGHPCLVLEYIPGLSMHALRSSSPLPAGLCCLIGQHIAEALATIHSAKNEQGADLGMLHRDVTPGNILISLGGQPKLIDLGIARAFDSAVTKTSTGELRGTLRFLAPELLADAKQSTSTDLWALGIVLLEAALGESLYRGTTHEILINIIRQPALENVDTSRLDPRLLTLLRPLLASDPAQRDHDARVSAARFAAAAAAFGVAQADLAEHVRVACLEPRNSEPKTDDDELTDVVEEQGWSSLLDARTAFTESPTAVTKTPIPSRPAVRRGFLVRAALLACLGAVGLVVQHTLLQPPVEPVEPPVVRLRLEDLVPGSVLVPRGKVWRYDDSADQVDDKYAAVDFDDSHWKTGPAPLGYGDDTIVTVISYGGDPARKHASALFRTTFDVADLAKVAGLRANVVYDDGIVVLLNGKRILSDGVPPGATPLHWATRLASSSEATEVTGLADVTEHVFYPFFLRPRELRAGKNVLAVQINQNAPSSSDLEFNLELVELRRPPTP